MAAFSPRDLDGKSWFLDWPFKLVYLSLAAGGAAGGLSELPGALLAFVSIVFMLVSLLGGGAAVWLRLSQRKPDTFDERCATGILVALASGCALAALATLRRWDSVQAFMVVLWVVTLVAVGVLLLPRLYRRIAVSFLVLFHFGGILTAVTAVQLPNNAPLPWLPTVLWNSVYRKYLTFTYLNNAYHFYSPEPGPPSLVWFQIIFDAGKDQNGKPVEKTYWKRLVRRDELPTRQQYQRFLSLTESVNQPGFVPPSKMLSLQQRRAAMAQPFSPFQDAEGKSIPIPLPQEIPVDQQYREPSDLAKKYLESYAAYVCRTTQHPDDSDLKVKSVRIYRLTHQLIRADQMVSKLKPTDPTLFWAYFQGEYEYLPENKAAGKSVVALKGSPFKEESPTMTWWEMRPNGTTVERTGPVQDPFLYWLLPIYRMPKQGFENSPHLRDYDLIDCLSLHAREKIKWDE